MRIWWLGALLGMAAVACAGEVATPSPTQGQGHAATSQSPAASATPARTPSALTTSPAPTVAAPEATAAGTPATLATPSPPATPQSGPDETPTAAPDSLPLTALSVEPAFPELSLDRMVFLAQPDDGTNRLFVVLQPGRIVVFPDDAQVRSASTFLDITSQVNDQGNEEGLLGLAFDPTFRDNGHFYVYYSISESKDSLFARLWDAVLAKLPVVESGSRWSVVSRFTVHSNDSNAADPSSERIFLVLPQPFSNHNGGNLAFGPDGYLYIGLGDGGGAGDRQGNGQDPATLLGSILRVDVNTIDSTGTYAVPDNNPLVGRAGARGEVWAYGLRNPWRFSFDRLTGELWAADVGQNSYEEVDLIRPGGNYGWNVTEGFHCFEPSTGCDQTGLVPPVAEYGRGDGCSVTGGYVYRGTRLPSLYGAYVYGDFCSGKVWALRHDGQRVVEHMEIADTPLNISSFAEDLSGELYILSFDGKIYRFVP